MMINKIIENLKILSWSCHHSDNVDERADDGYDVDNTADEYVNPWLDAVKDIKPCK